MELWRSGITTLNGELSGGAGSGDETGRSNVFSASGWACGVLLSPKRPCRDNVDALLPMLWEWWNFENKGRRRSVADREGDNVLDGFSAFECSSGSTQNRGERLLVSAMRCKFRSWTW